MKQRDFRLDFIRAISMLIIVLYHYSCVYELENTIGPLRPFWHFASGSWGGAFVVTFFMLSGHAMYIQYNLNIDVREFYRKRFLRIFPLFYVCWAIMYIVRTLQYKTFTWGGNPLLIIESLLGMDGYLKNGQLNYYSVGDWFLGAIILIYVIFPIILYCYKKLKWQITCLIFAFFMVIEVTGLVNFVSRSNMLICCSSFWIGMLVGEYSSLIKKHKYPLIISMLVIIVLCVVDLSSCLSEVLILEIFGIASYIFLYSIPVESIKEKNPVRTIIKFMSKYSYAVMLTHHVLVYWGIHLFEKIGINLNLCLFVTVFGIYFISFILSIMTDRAMGKFDLFKRRKKCKGNS